MVSFCANKYKHMRFHPAWPREQQQSPQSTPHRLDLAQKVGGKFAPRTDLELALGLISETGGGGWERDSTAVTVTGSPLCKATC